MNTLTKSLLALSSSVIVLGACVNPDGTRNNTGTGLGIGALTGAAIGAAIDDNDGRGAVLGGIIGGAIGGAVGNQLDQQEAELRQSIGASGARIVNTGDRLIVTLPEAITFPVDSAEVKPSLQPALRSLATSLNNYPNTIAQVVGHTDNTGSEAHNNALSQRRASAVANLIITGGVSSSRIQTLGQGERSPIASNATPEGRQQNRRVEINIIPTQ